MSENHPGVFEDPNEARHQNMSKGGGLKKTCPACKNKIFNGFKKCPMCKAPQPKNVRLNKKIEKFERKKKIWVANTKKNQVTSHLWDDAIILIEKLHAVGWRPLLLVEYPHKKAKMILPKDKVLGKSAQTCVENIYEIFKMMVEVNTEQATDSSHEPEEATVTLNFEITPLREQDSVATISVDQGAGTVADFNKPPTGQDLTSGMSLDQGAGTEDGPEWLLSPPPTVQDSVAAVSVDQGAGTVAVADQPATGQGKRRNQRKRVRTKDCPHNNRDVHPYRGIIRTRQRKGKTELLYDWMPCDLCGKTWPPTWQTA
ncbi:uncharacterized protein LOC143735229 isoform X3 [Siphateles boraxobius]|uniref:uncharacterized protein LOC143730766 n=2 Tax=Siphateles boraxobius TaxID=180520 RepID=UPI00406442B3